ncbi:MAG: hypothetical protein QF926_05910 [Alphaproteobacteria bacterium]|nr:hypothetical protein [Alphaproteobacteria bacterium]
MSWLGRRWPLWALIEKNLVFVARTTHAFNPRNKLRVETPFPTKGFETRLTELVRICQRASASVVFVNADGALRSGQSRWRQRWAAASYLFYMPYLTIPAILELQGAYQKATRDVAARTGCALIEITDTIPADRAHFADSSHYRDPGSHLAAAVIGEAMIASDLLPRRSRAEGVV